MNGLPYDPKQPGGLPWAAKRIEKILERERRAATQRRRRPASKPATGRESATATGPRTVPSGNPAGTIDDAFLARWGRGGLLDPALWARGTRPAAPAAPFGLMNGPSHRAAAPMPRTSVAWLHNAIDANRAYPTFSRPGVGSPTATYEQAAVAAPVPAPFPVPLPLPPVFIPGTPENKAFTDSTLRFYNWLKRSLPGDRGRDADCDEEWQEAYRICFDLMSKGGGSRNMTGGYTNPYDCAKGFVSERCGGNPVDRGGRRPAR